MNHFIRGGDVTVGGVMHAATSVAQILDDADAEHELESQALRPLDPADYSDTAAEGVGQPLPPGLLARPARSQTVEQSAYVSACS